MTIKFFWRCENSTSLDATHDYSAGDTTGSGSGSPSFSASAAKVGSYGISVAASTLGSCDFDAASIIPNAAGSMATSEGSAGFWLQYTAAVPPAGHVAAFLMQGSTATGDLIGVYTASSEELSMRVGKNGVGVNNTATAAANLSSGAWYGVIIRWNLASNLRKIEVYNSSGTLISDGSANDDQSAYYPATVDLVRCGRHAATTTTTGYYTDAFIISDVYDEVTIGMLAYDSYTDFPSGTTITPNPASVSAC